MFRQNGMKRVSKSRKKLQATELGSRNWGTPSNTLLSLVGLCRPTQYVNLSQTHYTGNMFRQLTIIRPHTGKTYEQNTYEGDPKSKVSIMLGLPGNCYVTVGHTAVFVDSPTPTHAVAQPARTLRLGSAAVCSGASACCSRQVRSSGSNSVFERKRR
jgi:hypothetical protein